MTIIALAQYPLDKFTQFSAWKTKVRLWVEEAVNAGANLLLFPEYGAMELTSLLPVELQQDLHGQLNSLQTLLPEFLTLYQQLAKEFGIYLIAPSIPVKVDEEFRNRAYVFNPEGRQAFQEKRQMTRFENEQWLIRPGDALNVFSTPWGNFGITICYDTEFPLLGHHYAMAGADLLLVPSCTDTLAGHHRVHIGARARALENQIYVVTAPTVGDAAWSPAVDCNIGYAAAYSIPDRGFPNAGILAQGELNSPGWVYASLELETLKVLREQGQVMTRQDWSKQLSPPLVFNSIEF